MFGIAAITILCLYMVLAVLSPGIALATAPVAYSVMGFAAVAFGKPEMCLLAVVGFVATLAVIALWRRGPDSEAWPHRWAGKMLFGVVLLTLVIVGAVATVFFDSFGTALVMVLGFAVVLWLISLSGQQVETPPWYVRWARLILRGLGALILLVLAAVAGLALYALGFGLLLVYFGVAWLALVLISYGLSLRHASDIYVLSTIGASMRQNLPLPMALDQAAAGRTDKRAQTLLGIKKWLVQGFSLSESIERGWPRCPGHALGMIRTAERIGQLPWAFGAIEANMLAREDQRRRIRPVHPVYPLIVITWALCIISGLMKFVFPQFKSVINEMLEPGQQQSLPAVTRVLFDVMEFMYHSHSLALAVFGLLLVVGIMVSIRVRFRPRRPDRPYLVSQIGDFVKWRLPALHWFEKNYSLVQTVEMLRLSLSSGSTINGAIANTLGLDVNCRFKARLKRWLTKVESGDNVARAAKSSGLGGSLAWAFDDSVSRESTPAILEMLESFYRSNYSYAINLARFILWPCAIVLLGATVGFIVFGTFSVGIVVLTNLAQNIYP